MLNQRFSFGNGEMLAPPSDYESQDEEINFEQSNGNDELSLKRRKLNEDERVQRCRERNRIHARNTRERKRAQMDLLQQRIQELSDEKKSLENYEPEESVASILMSLSSSPKTRGKYFEDGAAAAKEFDQPGDESSKRFAADAIERIKSEISATLSDDEELEMNSDILLKDKSACTSADLEMIRRERNRMHAKKTRLRKKKMLSEMESIIVGLERDIKDLRQRHNLGPDEYTGSMDFRRRPSSNPNSSNSLTISGSVGGSKFTGFRHVHRSEGAVVVKGSFSDASLSSTSGSTTSASSSQSLRNNRVATDAGFPSEAVTGGAPSSTTPKLSLSVAQQLAKATAALKEREQVVVTNTATYPATYPATTTAETSAAFKPYLASKRDSALVSPSVTSSNRSVRSNSTSSNSSQSGESQQFLHPAAAATSVGNFLKSATDSGDNRLSLQSLQGRDQGEIEAGGYLKRTISDLTNTTSNAGGGGFDKQQDVAAAVSRAGSGSTDECDDHRRCVNMLFLAATAAAANDA